MFSIAQGALALILTLLIGFTSGVAPTATTPTGQGEQDQGEQDRGSTDMRPVAIVGAAPVISFVGGTPASRQTVSDAVERYTSNNLALPDLEVRFHADNEACKGHRGLFRPNDGSPSIDLCFDTEFLVLHELGHAWVYANLKAADRDDFQELVGASTWWSHDAPHSQRASEIAADTLAHGLLSSPVGAGQSRVTEFARFEALTGSSTPRELLAEAVNEAASVSSNQQANAAAFAQWKQQAATPSN